MSNLGLVTVLSPEILVKNRTGIFYAHVCVCIRKKGGSVVPKILVTLTEESLIGKIHFSCSVSRLTCKSAMSYLSTICHSQTEN